MIIPWVKSVLRVSSITDDYFMGSNYYLICYLIVSLTVFPLDVSHDYIKLTILSD